MDTELLQTKIKEVNLIRFDNGWGTVIISLVQGLYSVRAYGEKLEEYDDIGLYRTPKRAIEELERLKHMEY